MNRAPNWHPPRACKASAELLDCRRSVGISSERRSTHGERAFKVAIGAGEALPQSAKAIETAHLSQSVYSPQLGAPDYESGGRRFESFRARQHLDRICNGEKSDGVTFGVTASKDSLHSHETRPPQLSRPLTSETTVLCSGLHIEPGLEASVDRANARHEVHPTVDGSGVAPHPCGCSSVRRRWAPSPLQPAEGQWRMSGLHVITAWHG